MSTRSHLHRADHPAWRCEEDYNPDATTGLAAAYASIRHVPAHVAGFREAGYQVIALRDAPMCPQQRMNLCYILGMAHAADDEYPEALTWLDQAVAVARRLGDRPAEADLLFLRGPVAQRMDLYADALHDYRIALDLRTTLRQEHPPVYREQELHLLVWAAGYALTQEEYALTRRLLSVARRAARRMAIGSSAVVAYHDWFLAGYLDARGHPERALQPALRAAAAAERDGGEPYAVVRIYALAARLAVDLAATHEEHSVGRMTHLAMAGRCLRAARAALSPNDRAGKGFIEMRQARLDSLRHRVPQALDRIGDVERLARDLDDAPLLAQALTVHGQILAARRESWEAALSQYREARAIAEARGVPYAALPARRALRRLEELIPCEE